MYVEVKQVIVKDAVITLIITNGIYDGMNAVITPVITIPAQTNRIAALRPNLKEILQCQKHVFFVNKLQINTFSSNQFLVSFITRLLEKNLLLMFSR